MQCQVSLTNGSSMGLSNRLSGQTPCCKLLLYYSIGKLLPGLLLCYILITSSSVKEPYRLLAVDLFQSRVSRMITSPVTCPSCDAPVEQRSVLYWAKLF